MSAPVYHLDLVQGSEEWFKIRLGKLTASNFSDAITPTRKAAYKKLKAKIVGERLSGCVKSTRQSGPMAHGSFWEDAARKAYEAKHAFVTECGFIDHGTIKNLGYSPDGLVGDDGLIEIKCPNLDTFLMWREDGEIPKEHIPQLIEGLLCSQRKWCDFVAFYPSHNDVEALEDGDRETFGEVSIHDSINLIVWRYEPSSEELGVAEKAAKKFLLEVDEMLARNKPEAEF